MKTILWVGSICLGALLPLAFAACGAASESADAGDAATSETEGFGVEDGGSSGEAPPPPEPSEGVVPPGDGGVGASGGGPDAGENEGGEPGEGEEGSGDGGMIGEILADAGFPEEPAEGVEGSGEIEPLTCIPGCVNQACPGKYDYCSVQMGECKPVPCQNDSYCQGLEACDKAPNMRTHACDTAVGQCVLAGSEAPALCLGAGLCIYGNRSCPGIYDTCLAAVGECVSLACQDDEDCEDVGKCDKPDGTGSGYFICDVNVKKCKRSKHAGPPDLCVSTGSCSGGNKSCPGTYDLCMASEGECMALYCETDEDCEDVGKCDKPDGTGTGHFGCDLPAGKCKRG